MALLLCLYSTVGAQKFVVNGIFYQLNNDKNALSVAVPEEGNTYADNISIPGEVTVPAEVMEGTPTLPVTEIAQNAFKSSQLTAVSIPSSITKIGINAFLYCHSLTKATFENVAQICATTFGNADSNPLNVTHHLYIGSSEVAELVIPSSVTAIGQNAFYGASALTSVNIPASVQSVGKNAFSGCTSLTKAQFASVSSLCNITFSNEYANPLYLARHLYFDGGEVTNITIPTGRTTINAYTFAGGSELSKVTIPAGVTRIGASAFKDCKKIGSVDFASIDQVLTMKYDDKDANPLSFGGYLLVGGNVQTGVTITGTTVNANLFVGSKWLKTATLAEGVTTIDENAFKGCTSLTAVSLPSTLNTIGKEAFNGCTALEAISLPVGLQSIGVQAFRDCRKLTSVVIPNSTSLADEVFMYCTKLETVTLPNTIITIPQRLFAGCSQLKNMELPSTVQTIDNGAFSGCQSLTTLPLSDNLTTIRDNAFEGCKGFTELNMSEKGKVNWIGQSAFSSCTSLTSVTLPSTLQNILANAFYGCGDLSHVYCYATAVPDAKGTSFGSNIGNMTLHVPSASAVTAYSNATPWNLFKTIVAMGSRKLTFYVNDNTETPFYTIEQAEGTTINASDVPEPEGIFSGWDKEIPALMPGENMVFYGYTSQKKTINGLSYHLLPAEQLNGKGLKRRATVIPSLDGTYYTGENIAVPDTVKDGGIDYPVTAIADNTFKKCENTYTITLPSTVKELGMAAFKGCSKLQTFIVPNGVTILGDSLFFGCTALGTVTLPGSITEVRTVAFCSCKSLELTSLPQNLTKIGKQAFRECDNITTIEIPASVKEMDMEAFLFCLKLKDVTFADGFSISLPERTFLNCQNLETVTLQGGMKNIGSGAFENCVKLTNIVLPSGMTTIGGNAFRGCTKLSNVTLPATMLSLGDQAFAGCTAINQFTVNCTTPPAALSTSFDVALKTKNAYLYVPEGDEVKARYNKEPWNYFKIGSRETKTLTYIVDDGQGTIGEGNGAFEKTQTFTVMVGDKIIPLAAPKDGDREFQGWDGLPDVMPNEDVTATGKFKYQVKFYENSVADANRLLANESFWFFYGDKITVPEEKLTRAKNTFSLQDMPTNDIMPATDIDVVVNYSLSEAETTVDNVNYKIWILQDRAEVMPTPGASGNINIREKVTYGGKDYPVTAIQDEAFKENKQVASLTLPSSLRSIGTQAFRGCKITSITLPAGMTELGTEAFLYCGSLKTVIFAGNGITELPARIFQNCGGINTIDLPDNLQTIGEGAFNGCSHLTEIDLPASVTAIADYAFTGCTALSSFTINSTTLPTASEATFDETHYENTTLSVPAGVNPTSKPWSLFAIKEGSLTETCATPTISYENGMVTFACATPGVTFVSDVKIDDSGERTSNSVKLTRTYIVSVYARKDGYKRSQTATKTILWRENGDANGDGEVDIADAVHVVNYIVGKIHALSRQQDEDILEPQ